MKKKLYFLYKYYINKLLEIRNSQNNISYVSERKRDLRAPFYMCAITKIE